MDIKLPRLGEGADSGTVVSIHVKEGDTIKNGDLIIELENEKAVAPIPSSASGKVIKLYVKEGDKLSVGQNILSLEEGAGAPVVTPKKAEATPVKETKPEPVIVKEEVSDEPKESKLPPAASPTVRKIARDLGIDLTRIRGTERGGRIVLSDLKSYIHRLQELAQSKQAASSATPATKPIAESIDFSKWGKVTRKPLTGLRKTISQRMSESWSAVPRVTQFDEADITNLMELRKKYAAKYEKKGTHLTITPIAMKAVVAALKKHPLLNSSLDEATHEIVYKEYYHLGIAVDTEAGLIVPVIRDVDKKNLFDLSAELDVMAEKAKSRKLSLEELKGGSFTISNQGGIGGGHFTPIVNTPELAILGIGRGTQLPRVVNDKIQVRLILPITLAYDHRLIDGANAVRFFMDFKQNLEQFKESELKI